MFTKSFEISIHALREEGDIINVDELHTTPISIHALREEGDLSKTRLATASFYFYPRPPRGGRPDPSPGGRMSEKISIHALREEGDAPTALSTTNGSDFYPRPPRGGRHRQAFAAAHAGRFLSTPSARRATHGPFSGFRRRGDFYPRPPRGGRPVKPAVHNDVVIFLSTPSARRATVIGGQVAFPFEISIHALREEGDVAFFLLFVRS